MKKFIHIYLFLIILLTLFFGASEKSFANHCATIGTNACNMVSGPAGSSCPVQCSNDHVPGDQTVGCNPQCPADYDEVAYNAGDDNVVCGGLCTNKTGCKKRSTCDGCTYIEDCQTPAGEAGKRTCNGRTEGGVCKYNSSCEPSCSTCVKKEQPKEYKCVAALCRSCPNGDANSPECKEDFSCCHREWGVCVNGQETCVTVNNTGGQKGQEGKCNFSESPRSCGPGNTPTPTKTPTPTRPVATATPRPNQPRCDAGCGTCGYRLANNTCTTNPSCCSVTPTPRPTTFVPTPTPDFNAAMCKCAGIEAQNLFAGGKATINAYGKVEGTDVTKAKITNMKYFLLKGKTTTGSIVSRSGPIAATVLSRTATEVKYQTQWKPTIPANPEPGSVYTIWARITCEPANATAVRYSPIYEAETAVLGAQTEEKKGFFDTALAIVFGKPKTQPVETPAPTGEVLAADTIQIDTFYPAQKVENLCYMLRFEFSDGSNP